MAPPAPQYAAQDQVHHAPGGGQAQANAAKGQERLRLFAFLAASKEQGGQSTPHDFQNFVQSASQLTQHFAPPLASMNPQEQHHPNQQPTPEQPRSGGEQWQLPPPQQQPQQPHQQQRKYLTQQHPHQQQQLLSGQYSKYQQTPQVCLLPTQICVLTILSTLSPD
jgi:hypothetical protein